MGKLLALALASGLWPTLALADAASDSQITWNLDPHGIKRIDPVGSPGDDTLSCGANVIFGASNADSSSTSDSLRGAQCSTSQTGIDVDASTFGASALYFQHPNRTFSAVRPNNMAVTWTMYAPNGLTPFPDQFSYTAGDIRGYDPECGTEGHPLPQGGYFYGDEGNAPILTQYEGGQMGATWSFPDCWSGYAFDHFNQSQHMSFSNNYICDPAHPKKLAKLTVNTYFHITDLPTIGNFENFVLSSGDPFGCANTAWAVIAFQPGVFDNLVKDCSKLGHGNSKNCPWLELTPDNAALTQQCRATGPIPAEDVGLITPTPWMPGCNVVGERVGKPCLFNVPRAEPVGYATQARAGPAGIPYWTPDGSAKRSLMSVATSNPWNFWACKGTLFTDECRYKRYNFNECNDFENFGSAPYGGAFRSAGTENGAQCTIYSNSDCTGTSLVLAQGGSYELGALDSNAYSFKCSQR